jgi:hypothetical protein
VQKVYGITTALFIVLSQLFLLNGFDVARVFNNECMLFGICGLALVLWKVNPAMLFMLLPFCFACIIAPLHWVSGYTAIRLAEILGYTGIMIFVAHSEPKWIFRALIGFVFIQIFYTYFQPNWSMQFPKILNPDNPFFINRELYSWGLFRNQNKFSLVMYSCFVIGLVTIPKEKAFWKMFAILGTIAAFVYSIIPFSNAVVPITILTLSFWLLYKVNWKIACIPIAILVFGVIIFKLHGFEYDIYRIANIKLCLAHAFDGVDSFFIGHGIGSFKLLIADGHPHNELLNILFEQGILGVIVWLVFLSGVLVLSLYNPLFTVGIALFFAATLTNSLRYTDVWFMFSILCGLGIYDCNKMLKSL